MHGEEVAWVNQKRINHIDRCNNARNSEKGGNLRNNLKHNHFGTFITITNEKASMNSEATKQSNLTKRMEDFTLQHKNPGIKKDCNDKNRSTGDLTVKNLENKAKTMGALHYENYYIFSELGKGTYGTVKLGYNRVDKRTVALKIINRDKLTKRKQIRRVHNEARILSILDHPNICKLYRAIETRKNFVLEMEYIKGKELFTYIKGKKMLTEIEAREMFLQILDGVNYLHKHRIIHRDLKPENMIVTDDGQIKIIDFGFASSFEYGQYCEVHCGSPYYASPEMVNSVPYTGPEVDIWSMGIILYSMVHGKQPFMGSEIKIVYENILKCEYELDENLSPGVKDLISKMICLKPENRITVDGIAKHKWLQPCVLPKYPITYIYEVERRALLRLVTFDFVSTSTFSRLSNPLSSESFFYRLLLKKFHKEKYPYTFTRMLTLTDLYLETRIIESLKIPGTKVINPFYSPPASSIIEIIDKYEKIEPREINITVLCFKLVLIRRYIEFANSNWHRLRIEAEYLQFLVVKEESVLLRIYIEDVSPLKCIAKFVLICGNEDIFCSAVAEIVDNVF